MGLLSSSNKVNSTTETNDFTTANSLSGGEIGGSYQPVTVNGNSAPVSLSMTDFGAVSGGLDLARLGLDKGTDAFASALTSVRGIADNVVGKSLGIAAQNQVDPAVQAQGLVLKIAALLVVGVVIYAIAKKGS